MNNIRNFKYKFWLRYFLSSSRCSDLSYYKGKRKCMVCLAADYGNLGDVAITLAQTEYLHRHLQGYEILDFPISRTLSDLKALKNVCEPDDIITIVGGGNMGDMYYDIELLRLLVVRSFPNNRIISFPQTIDYSDSSEALWLERFSQKVYERHRNLLLCAREKISFQRMKTLYPNCNVVLTPDIVMYLDKGSPEQERNGITFCLRNDRERGDCANVVHSIRKYCLNREIHVTDYDTHIGAVTLSVDQRQAELDNIWQQFRQSKWVITDRLHGMIFAYITRTPAIVFANSNFKIRQNYQWIKDCGYIHFVDSRTSIEECVEIMECKQIDNFCATHENIMKRLDSISLL